MDNMFNKKVKVFFKELGIEEKKINQFLESQSPDYPTFLRNVGAEMVEYRKALRAIEGVGNRGLILPGGNVVIMTIMPNGEIALLVQKRDDGTIGFSGGACEEWRLGEKTAVESPYLTAFREFAEEVGETLNEDLEFFDENTSTIVYPSKDVAYGISMFYRACVPYEKVIRYAKGGSEEGKMTLLTLREVKEVPLFPNHAPIFLRLLEEEA